MESQTETFQKEWHYATSGDKDAGVETAIYKNGKPAKRFKISDGKEVVVRRLKAKDYIMAEGMVAGNQSLVTPAMLHLAIKVDGRMLPMEDIEELDGPDYLKIKNNFNIINF